MQSENTFLANCGDRTGDFHRSQAGTIGESRIANCFYRTGNFNRCYTSTATECNMTNGCHRTLGVRIDVKPAQSEKANSPMVVTELGSSIDVKPEQPLKALSPIVLTLSVSISLFNEFQTPILLAILLGTMVPPIVKSLTEQPLNIPSAYASLL